MNAVKISRLALMAAAGMLLGVSLTPAQAADLGGGCCADLEERVAELEATTVRKGNRVVSLQLYGQVNKGLLIWDDGVDSDAFVVDNAMASSHVGLIGKATIKPGWTAGYNIEFEINDAMSDKVHNGYDSNWDYKKKQGDDPEGSTSTLVLRQNNFYIESDKLGRITLGHGSTAADGANEVVIANSLRSSDVKLGDSLLLRYSTPGGNTGYWEGTLRSFGANNLDAGRNDVVRWDSPSIYGFIMSASWGDNDYADLAVRFKKDFGSLRVAAALAYIWDNQTSRYMDWNGTELTGDYEQVGGSISAMHMPTGIYAAFQAASREYKEPYGKPEQSFWYLQGGVERKFMPMGATTVYGEYGKYTMDWYTTGNYSYKSESTRFGFGLNQRIDSAAVDLYANATFWSFDDDYAKAERLEIQDLHTLMIGSRIQF